MGVLKVFPEAMENDLVAVGGTGIEAGEGGNDITNVGMNYV